MARRMSDARKRAATVQAGRRDIARDERPVYRVAVARWSGTAPGRRAALADARAVIANGLEVAPDRIEVATVDR